MVLYVANPGLTPWAINIPPRWGWAGACGSVEFISLMMSEPAGTFGLVFGFSRSFGLPLHVEGGVRSSAFQRVNVINHVTAAGSASLASRWTGVLPLKSVSCFATPLYSSMGIRSHRRMEPIALRDVATVVTVMLGLHPRMRGFA